MSTQQGLRLLHDEGRCNFDTCPLCWEEHEVLISTFFDDCPDCGMRMEVCECRPDFAAGRVIVGGYTNADRMEDVEAHHPMGDGGATYLDD